MGTENERKTFENVPSENIRRSPRLDSLDYGAVLADLQAKRAALDQAITSLQAAAASGALTAAVGDSMVMADSVAVGLHGGEVPVGAFLGKSIPEAARLCLQIVKRKMTSREISDALKKGGIETTASNFPSLVHSILTRASSKSPSEILNLTAPFGDLRVGTLLESEAARLRERLKQGGGGVTEFRPNQVNTTAMVPRVK